MKTTLYPSIEEALRLHQLLIERFGGTHGVRDIGLLESAIARSKSGYYETLVQQAAALFHSLINNHCFVDGNKRIAFALTAVFLKMNGCHLRLRAASGEKFIVEKIIAGRADANEIAIWLERYITKKDRL